MYYMTLAVSVCTILIKIQYCTCCFKMTNRVKIKPLPSVMCNNVTEIDARCNVKCCACLEIVVSDGNVVINICKHKWGTISNKSGQRIEAMDLSLGEMRTFLHSANDGNFWKDTVLPCEDILLFISLASRFDSKILKEKLFVYLTREERMNNFSASDKLRIYQCAYKHREECPIIFQVCVRFCIKIPITYCVSQLEDCPAMDCLSERKEQWAENYGVAQKVISVIKGQSVHSAIPLPPLPKTVEEPPLKLYLETCGCPVSGCEIKLKLQDKNSVFVCRHRLAEISAVFNNFFAKKETKIRSKLLELNRDDMILLLENTRNDSNSLPANKLPILISLADRFSCISLTEKIIITFENGSLLAPVSPRIRGLIISSSYEHRLTQPRIYQACINAFSKMSVNTLSFIKPEVDVNLMLEVYEARIRQLSAKISRQKLKRRIEKPKSSSNRDILVLAFGFVLGIMSNIAVGSELQNLFILSILVCCSIPRRFLSYSFIAVFISGVLFCVCLLQWVSINFQVIISIFLAIAALHVFVWLSYF